MLSFEQKQLFRDEYAPNYLFEIKSYAEGVTTYNESTDGNYLVYCQSGRIRINSTLFHNELIYPGDILFIPKMHPCCGTALSDITLLSHRFNHISSRFEQSLFSFLYPIKTEPTQYRCKLTAPKSVERLMQSIGHYLEDQLNDPVLWQLKHRELIWLLTQHFPANELRLFFGPMIEQTVPFKNLVQINHLKAKNTHELAALCCYGIYTFRRHFKKEFGISAHQWLIAKRAERIKFRLLQTNIPLVEIMDEFHFDTPSHFWNFCKRHLGDTPANLRKESRSY